MSQTKVKSGLLNFPDQTDFVKLPSGTTAQRPSSPEKGYSRYNTTDNKLEYWNGTIWQQLPGVVPPTIESVSYPGDDLAADPAGGQTITLTGTNFLAGASVEIDGTTASVVTVVSGTEITFTAPAKAAGDYDIVLTNGDNTTATFVNGMSYNGVPSWTTAAGNLGTFPAGSTIPTITLVATEPDSGVVSYSVTTGALPTGLTLTGADIDGTVPSPAGQTTYNFSITASDDENQESTERAFNIVVYLQVTNIVDDVDPFDGNGVALYQLNGDATDESGNYDGVVTGTLSYETGVFGQAGVFNGSNTGIQTGVQQGTNPFTWSAWLKPDNITSNQYAMSVYNPAAGANSCQFYLLVQGGNFKIGGYNGAEYIFTSPATIGTWAHLVLTYDGTGIVGYLNGAALGGKMTIPTPILATQQTLLGGTQGAGNNVPSQAWYDGSIDQVRIFNEALTPLEVQYLYQERTVVCGGQVETVDILGDNSCIALYPLDGNANDLSGNYSGEPVDVSYGVGEFDLAGVFNGSSSIVKNTDLGVQFRNQTNISMSCWFRTTQSVSLQSLFGFSATGDASTELFVNIRSDEGDALGFINRDNGTGIVEVRASGSGSVTDGNWHNVVFSASSSGTKLYLDGSELTSMNYRTGSSSTQISMPNDLNQFNIGASQDSSGVEFFYNGSIDQVRIFNKALNQNEVDTLFAESACAKGACTGTTNTLDILGDSSCIAAYPLDGSPIDLSGNYNGVQTDVTYPVGKFDLASSFNGSSSRINTSNLKGFSTQTWSLWIKPNVVNLRGYLLSTYQSGTIGEGSMYMELKADGKIEAGVRDVGGVTRTVTSASSLTANQWVHIAVTSDGSDIKLYVNAGTPTTNTATVGSLDSANVSPLVIGYEIRNNANYFNGSIDQVRIFNKALSAGEVTTLYNETACN